MVHVIFDINDEIDLNDFIQTTKIEEELEVIHEKNFNGTSMIVEVFINSIPAIALITPVIIAKIKKKNLSNLKIEGDKIEIDNVSEKFIKELLEKTLSNKSDKNHDTNR